MPIIWRLWHDHDAYDPARHTALQRYLATTGAEQHRPTHPRMKIGARRHTAAAA